jgi:phosphatidylserine/phosphatidylglycerophosphate/cardiolipin synthase-like enzyme
MPVRRIALALVLLGVVGVLLTGGYNFAKPLPDGLSFASPARASLDVRFLADLTYLDASGERRVDQTIFDEIFATIRGARERIVLDLFLFNEYQGELREETRALCSELTLVLLEKKRAIPEIEIVLITDPINTVYGGLSAPHLEQLREAGVRVVMTDLDPLRDSNGMYSAIWRAFVRPLGGESPGIFPNPFGGDSVSLRTDLRVLNFKANHRKTLVADSPEGWVGIVTSANPHDGSSAHGNLALRFTGAAVADLFESERAVADYSGASFPPPLERVTKSEGLAQLRILTEGKIGEALDETLSGAGAGDEIAVAVFYLSDRHIVRELVRAHERGARVRVLLDPNKDAFGRKKNGVPNRPVAAELTAAGIPVRWCDTHGEQCHAKMLLLRRAGEVRLIAGSANFTRRNLRDLNLETNVEVRGPRELRVMREAWAYFERVWANELGRRYSVDYEVYADESASKWWLYRVGEFTGIGTY